MTRLNQRAFLAAFALGLLAVAWVAAGFIGTNALALAMTLAIGAGFGVGAWELRQFRAQTAALAGALADIPQPLDRLEDWLARVPASLRQPVRLRVAGERAALPGPALTPYLVGLLVMLGMLGTFLGMVVTFKGAVFALEGSADLQAMRAALAEPIKGLGLSFGTSVAGVAASAMLGLMSTLARRERVEAGRTLDARAADLLRPFSPAFQREATLRALQEQAAALPRVAEHLEAFMVRMEQRSEALDQALHERQARFQEEATRAYGELARSVGSALQDSLAAGARAAGESIRPVVESTLARVAQDTQALHTRLAQDAQATHQRVGADTQQLHERLRQDMQRLSEQLTQDTRQSHERLGATADAQVARLSERFEATARGVAEGWQSALQTHAATSDAVATRLQQALAQFATGFEARSAALLEAVNEQLAQAQARQVESEAQRLQAWTQALERLAAEVQAQWHQAGEQALAQQQAVGQALAQAAGAVAQRASEQAGRAIEDATQLLARGEALVRERVASEERWAGEHRQRMDQLAALWREELAALRAQEQAQGEAAVARLGELQAAVTQHLATLGEALEAPMTRLLHTAAEVPQAAAGVISQLREEMGRLSERDNLALQERTALLAELGTLIAQVQQSAGAQREAVQALVDSSSQVMAQAGERFAESLQAQAGRAEDVATQVTGSAVELAALAEGFAQGVQAFQATSDKLVESLERIEAAIGQSTARSDEQLAYYVAQAREVIDLSIASQQGLVDSLRQLQQPEGARA